VSSGQPLNQRPVPQSGVGQQVLGGVDQRRVPQQQLGVQYQQLIPVVDQRNDQLDDSVVVQPQSLSRVRVVNVPLSSLWVTNPWSSSRVGSYGSVVGRTVPLRQQNIQLLSGITDGVQQQQQQYIPQQYPVSGIQSYYQNLSPVQVSTVGQHVSQHVSRPVQQSYVDQWSRQSPQTWYPLSGSQLVQPLQYSTVHDLSLRRNDESNINVDNAKPIIVIDSQTEPHPGLYAHHFGTKSVVV